MSLAATSYVLGRQFGGQLRKLLMLVLADFADETGAAWAAIDTLAFRAECSRRAVQDNLAELVSSGELEVIPNAGPRGCNVYRIFKNQPPQQELFPMPSEGGAAAAPPPVHGGVQQLHGGGAAAAPPIFNGHKEGGTPPYPPCSPSPEFSSQVRTALAGLFPLAAAALTRQEVRSARYAAALLAEWTAEDWTAARAWLDAPTRVRGRPRWPRDRAEFLANAGELTETIRRWWRASGAAWWRSRQRPAENIPEASPQTSGNVCGGDQMAFAEAIAILRAGREKLAKRPQKGSTCQQPPMDTTGAATRHETPQAPQTANHSPSHNQSSRSTLRTTDDPG